MKGKKEDESGEVKSTLNNQVKSFQITGQNCGEKRAS